MTSSKRPVGVVLGAGIDTSMLERARQMRHAPTAAEAAAWEILRGRKLFGLKFRRQQVVAGYVVDFYCPALRLALEIDGGVHCDLVQREHDVNRDNALRARSILRLPNHHVDPPTLRTLLAPYALPTRPR